MTLSRTTLAFYGLMGLPLAFAGLPIYVYFPTFYGDVIGLPFVLLGIIILLARLVDTVQDPVIGWLSDRYASQPVSRYRFILYAAPVTCLGFLMLFMPPDASPVWISTWLVAALIVTYSSYSVIAINIYSLAAELTEDYHEQTRLTTTREAYGLIGALVASVLPFVLIAEYGEMAGYRMLAWCFLPIMLIPAIISYAKGPRPVSTVRSERSLLPGLKLIKNNARFRRLALIYLINNIAASIPASVFLLYVKYVIGAPESAGYFLVCYFVAGAAGMPLWLYLSKRSGKRRAWLLSMAVAIVTFMWASTLGEGDVIAFFIICFLSGLALGADMGLPPSMLADHIPDRSDSGMYFGVWALLSKLALAVAGGLSFLLLGLLGFDDTSNPQEHLFYLALVYALLPCGIKVISALLLRVSDIDPFTSGGHHVSTP